MRIMTLPALVLFLAAVPAVASETSDVPAGGAEPFPPIGEELYLRNCRACHGPRGASGSGGQIRGSSERTVRRALGGTDGMPEFDFPEDEVSALVAYIEYLDTLD